MNNRQRKKAQKADQRKNGGKPINQTSENKENTKEEIVGEAADSKDKGTAEGFGSEKDVDKKDDVKKENAQKDDTDIRKDDTVKENASKDDSGDAVEKKSDSESKLERYAEFYEQEPYIDKSVHKKKKLRKVCRAVLLTLFVVLAAVYFGGVFYFSSHFAGEVTLNGCDISWMNVSDAQELLDGKISDYTLTVEFKNGAQTVSVGDGDMEVSLATPADKAIKEQNPWIWPLNLFDSFQIESAYVVTYDREKMKQFLNGTEYMEAANMEASTNARVRMSEGEVVVLPDVTGTRLDTELVYSSVCDALDRHRESVNLDACNCYIPAVITMNSECIERGVDNATAFLDTNIRYSFNGHEVPISKEELSTLAYVDTSGAVCLSKSNVEAFARKFARDNSTCYTYRDFETHDGRMISVYGGWFGWQLDEDACVADLENALSEALKGKNDIVLEPSYTHKGYTIGEYNDIGDTYVEVDLGNQQVFVYVDGEVVVETECVSGNKRKGMNTPGGLYAITAKGYKVTLIGEDYETPVTYWMPFNGGIGLHDATWRWAFGGTIYTYDGSHGCVNLPYKAAAEIYGIVEVGMPVVCYWD